MRRNRPALFKGRDLEAEIIVVCVGWYLGFALRQMGVDGIYLGKKQKFHFQLSLLSDKLRRDFQAEQQRGPAIKQN